MTMDTDAVELDVVIPTRDRPDQLALTLEALERQNFKRFGVIVVDDGGTPEARGLVPAALRDALAVRFVRNETSRGPGPTRNRGVAVSKAPYIVFLDDDCIADPDLIGRHHKVLSSAGGPTVSLGPILSPPGPRLPVWLHWDADRLERGYRELSSGRSRPEWRHLFTGNVGVRRADFLAVGGFDERFVRNEDTELGYRLDQLGCCFEFDPGALVWHESQRSLRGWMRIAKSTAHFDVEFDRLFADIAPLSTVEEELRTKHWALRMTRRIARGPVAARCAVTGAMSMGFLLHVVRADRAALAAFSLVRYLTYCEALRAATSAAGGAGKAQPDYARVGRTDG